MLVFFNDKVINESYICYAIKLIHVLVLL